MKINRIVRLLCLLTAGLLAVCPVALLAQAAQNSTGTIRGQVADPSGAVIPNAAVSVTSASGQSTTAASNATGAYAVRGLSPGAYSVSVTAQGFAPFQAQNVIVGAGQAKQLNLSLAIDIVQQQVQVSAENQTVDTNPDNNAN